MTTPLETDRLLFRNWGADDVQPFHAICSDPEVMRYVGDGELWSLRKTNQWIKHAAATRVASGCCRWPLILKETSELIGFCGFVPVNDGAEIGWRLARNVWGRGLATEAARAALTHGYFELGLRRVFALVQSPNRASIRVCEKLGLSFESQFLRNGREVNVYSTSRSARSE